MSFAQNGTRPQRMTEVGRSERHSNSARYWGSADAAGWADELDVADIAGEGDAATHGATVPSCQEKSKPAGGVGSSGLRSLLGTFREHRPSSNIGGRMFFTFPENARWDSEGQAVEFGVEIGEYQGVVRVPRRTFQQLLPERPTPERCVEAYYRSGRALRASPSGSFDGVN
jgi:hypothetical protein